MTVHPSSKSPHAQAETKSSGSAVEKSSTPSGPTDWDAVALAALNDAHLTQAYNDALLRRVAAMEVDILAAELDKRGVKYFTGPS